MRTGRSDMPFTLQGTLRPREQVSPAQARAAARRRSERQQGVDLNARVARLYHERGLSQSAIAGRLELSQPTVSRLLKRAEAERIVRVVVTHPSSTHPELEEGLQETYGLREAMVVDTATGDLICGDVLRRVLAEKRSRNRVACPPGARSPSSQKMVVVWRSASSAESRRVMTSASSEAVPGR